MLLLCINRLMTFHRRAALVLLLGLIISLCIVSQFKTATTIIKVIKFDTWTPYHPLQQQHGTRDGIQNATLRMATAVITASCSWTGPNVNNTINSNMDWLDHHFRILFRKQDNVRFVNDGDINTTDSLICPEHRLIRAAVPYFIYPQLQMFSYPNYSMENLLSNDLSSNPKVKPAYHRVDARYENVIFQALYSHPLRVHDIDEARLFIVPIPFGTICLDNSPLANRRKSYNEIHDNLLRAKPFQQGKPHVLISMTNPIFDAENAKRVRFGKLFPVLKNMTVARGDDHYAARYIHIYNPTPQNTNRYRGFESIFSTIQLVTEYTFSVGLGGQALEFSLITPSWDKFQNSSLFIFYHTRTKPSECDSTKFREAPIKNVSLSTALPRSSIGWSIPREQWHREFQDAKFCLVIRGDTPHSHSLFNAVKVGCLPVIISDWYPFYAPPFPATLDMRDFCIFIGEDLFMENPEKALIGLQTIPEAVIKEKLKALEWAQRVMMVDHPTSLFVPAFTREAFNSFSRPKSKLLPKRSRTRRAVDR